MSFKLQGSEEAVFGHDRYVNAKGHTECVTFLQQVAGLPHTTLWTKGMPVFGAASIPRLTAIATFDRFGRYPTDQAGRHAAIYLSHDERGISVLDQWRSQGEVKPRFIRFNVRKGTSRSNDGKTFYVVE